MSESIHVRDVVRGEEYDLPPGEPVLRGSYDLFRPRGPVILEGGLAQWTEKGVALTSRVAPTTARDLHPGERVLVRLEDSVDEWWLCDVESVDELEGELE
jgi:hypothetical protein